MRIAITTMTWKRPSVFSVWAAATRRLIRNFPNVDIIVTVAGSEGARSRERVEKFGFEYIEAPNFPIGKKANMRLKFTSTFNPDYVLLLGDDDILSDDVFQYYLDRIKDGFDEIAPLDIYYYISWLKTCAYSQGYVDHRKGEPVAVGRMLSKRVLNKAKWSLWADKESQYLDNHAIQNLKNIVKRPHYYRLSKTGGVILDMKTAHNMTKFQWRKNYSKIDNSILDKFPEKELICAALQ